MSVFKKLALASTAVALLALAGTAAEAGEVTIGYTGPLSGGAALYGKNILQGLEMASKEINAAGGFKVGDETYTINLVSLDDKYSPSESAVNAKRLRAQYGAPVIFVPHSGGTYALQEFNEADGFLVASYTSVPTVNQRGNKLTFRMPPSFLGYIDTFVKTEMGKFGKKLAIASADHDYAKAWAKAFGPAWTKAGGEVVAENPMSYNKDTDFYSGVARVLAANPDVLFVGGASEPTSLLIRQARELGFMGGFVIMDQAKMDEMARLMDGFDLLEGSVGVMPLVHSKRPGAESFVEKYRKQFNKDPGTEMSYNYSAINAVTTAMTMAGTTTDAAAIFAKLGEAYASLSPEKNPSQITKIDETGASNAPNIVGLVDKGTIVQAD